MARYIDADVLANKINELLKDIDKDIDEARQRPKKFSAKYIEGSAMQQMGIAHALQIVLEAPTADVVEVVRCKDCAYWQQNTVRQNSNDAGWWNEALCERHTIYGNEPHEAWTDADWFCADGERRSE